MDSSQTQVQGTQTPPPFQQNVVVLRHGDRIDHFDPSWVTTAARPWDPALIEQGLIRAYQTGRKFRDTLGFPLHRVFVSPFLRCIQTASQVVSALCAISDDANALTGNGVLIDPSKLKVSVEYGLCETFNSSAIPLHLIPKDGNWGFDLSEREGMFPAGTVDINVDRVYKELPQWGETVSDTAARYAQIVKDLADKYPSENLLLVTHAEGVKVAHSTFMKDAMIYEINYCAFTHLRRSISNIGTAGNFNVLTHDGQTGVGYRISSSMSDYDN